MKTKDKLKLARKLMSKMEISRHVSPYSSRAWIIRSRAIQKREVARMKVNRK